MTITSYGSTYPFVNTNQWWEAKSGQRQQPVTRSPLVYRRIQHLRTKVRIAVSDSFCSAANSNSAWYCGNFLSTGDTEMISTVNNCYAKFRAEMLAQPAQLGNTLGEFRQAVGMMTERVGQLTKSAILIKRGRIGEALKTLGILDRAYFYRDGKYNHFVDFKRCKTDENGRLFFETKRARKSGRKRFYVKRSDASLSPRVFYSKDFANTWLELHFGWVPLLQDIKSGLEVMTSVPPMKRVTVSASTAYTYDVSTTGYLWQPVRNTIRGQSVVRMGSFIRISNPNLYRANQLGIVNPLSVMWELTPWSFLYDWVANIGDCISAMSDMFGIELFEPFTTRYRVSESHDEDLWREKDCDYASIGIDRTLGIIGPTLIIRPFKLPGWSRLATAVSLMIQQFR